MTFVQGRNTYGSRSQEEHMTSNGHIMKQMTIIGREGFHIGSSGSVFICYAHEDNGSANPKECWLNRFLQIVKPLVRQQDLTVWSDRTIKIGDDWHVTIQKQLAVAKAVLLFVSPAFLASDYIANNELPVLLKRAKESGVPIFQLLISPCLYEETKFKYPDPKTGPEEFALSSLQAANAPSKTLIEMTEAEQNRVMLEVARALSNTLSP
jgi:TIR domain-containing protein